MDEVFLTDDNYSCRSATVVTAHARLPLEGPSGTRDSLMQKLLAAKRDLALPRALHKRDAFELLALTTKRRILDAPPTGGAVTRGGMRRFSRGGRGPARSAPPREAARRGVVERHEVC